MLLISYNLILLLWKENVKIGMVVDNKTKRCQKLMSWLSMLKASGS